MPPGVPYEDRGLELGASPVERADCQLGSRRTLAAAVYAADGAAGVAVQVGGRGALGHPHPGRAAPGDFGYRAEQIPVIDQHRVLADVHSPRWRAERVLQPRPGQAEVTAEVLPGPDHEVGVVLGRVKPGRVVLEIGRHDAVMVGTDRPDHDLAAGLHRHGTGVPIPGDAVGQVVPFQPEGDSLIGVDGGRRGRVAQQHDRADGEHRGERWYQAEPEHLAAKHPAGKHGAERQQPDDLVRIWLGAEHVGDEHDNERHGQHLRYLVVLDIKAPDQGRQRPEHEYDAEQVNQRHDRGVAEYHAEEVRAVDQQHIADFGPEL